ncbi:MAG: S26 family signal peptidase, partial [Acidobacteriia bacterium]|nr:S26 family signal peptidase [Terriglobia bacterium]
IMPYRHVHRGDIVVFHYPVHPSQHFVKRVVGVPGDRAILRQGKVLRVEEVHGDRGVRRVPDGDVPEPRGGSRGEHQRQGNGEPEPLAGRPQPGRVEPRREGTAWPEQWRPRDVGTEPPQIDVGRPALHLRSREQVEHDVAVLHPAERPVGIHVHDETGRALVAAGPGGLGCRHRVSSFIGV